MISSKPFLVVLFLAAVLINIHCSKPTGSNTAPVVRAGNDTTITQPVNYIKLRGSFTDAEFNISGFTWKQIAGAPSQIGTPAFYETKVHNLQPGNYSFELTVRDRLGLTGKDSIHIEVKPMPVGARVVDVVNLVWDCFWGCYTGLSNLSAYVPPGSPFEVYIKNDQLPDWIHVLPDSLRMVSTEYSFIFDSNHLMIEWLGQGNLGVNSSDLKLVY